MTLRIERLLGVSGAQQARQVRIGMLLHEPSNVEHILQRYCKQIFIHTGHKEFPYQFVGSGAALKFGERHILICTGHQVAHFNPDQVAIYVKSMNSTITASSLSIPRVTSENHDTDWIDVRVFEYQVENYAIPNLSSEFFPAEEECLWPHDDLGHFFIFGYPTERQDVDYHTPHIKAHVVEVKGKYAGASHSAFVHRLKMDRKETFDADGMSGGPIFYLGRKNETFFAGLAGITIRGSKTSDFIHFIEADFLRQIAAKEA